MHQTMDGTTTCGEMVEHTNESVECRDGGAYQWKCGVERWWSIQMNMWSVEMVEHTNGSVECRDGGAYQ